MKKIRRINGITLITEILGEVVQEKSELTWIVPFSKELNLQVCDELLVSNLISMN